VNGVSAQRFWDVGNKVPQVTIAFWIIKIFATTLGETGGDSLSMTLGLGYAASTAIFFGVFLVTLFAQIASNRYNPLLYWAVILSTTTAGTTMSDFLDRTAYLGYIGGSLLLVVILIFVLTTWRLTVGSITFDHVTDPKVEAFYWTTILFSNTLGTALGDFMADNAGLGYQGGALVIGAVLAIIACAYFFTRISRTTLFWLAFVMTRPLGATLRDTLTKTHAKGGLDLGTLPSSLVLAVAMVLLVLFAARRSPAGAGRHRRHADGRCHGSRPMTVGTSGLLTLRRELAAAETKP
jgi:uncharacterized membrane-anchored protein